MKKYVKCATGPSDPRIHELLNQIDAYNRKNRNIAITVNAPNFTEFIWAGLGHSYMRGALDKLADAVSAGDVDFNLSEWDTRLNLDNLKLNYGGKYVSSRSFWSWPNDFYTTGNTDSGLKWAFVNLAGVPTYEADWRFYQLCSQLDWSVPKVKLAYTAANAGISPDQFVRDCGHDMTLAQIRQYIANARNEHDAIVWNEIDDIYDQYFDETKSAYVLPHDPSVVRELIEKLDTLKNAPMYRRRGYTVYVMRT